MKFDPSIHKSVIVINEALPLGLAMNALSVIGVSLGRTLDGIVGPDIYSKDQFMYPGVINSPLPILKACQSTLNSIHATFANNQDVLLTPFSCLAQSCRTYDEYENKLSSANSDELELSGIGIVGLKKQVNKYTGSLSLYK
ncbi:DUF2000 domain-containing protein [Endozoicomonas sp. SM1973]|uniref:DUF2000 domain-containing protein n=1 Tax=Spartinivicinus marinus TaxID=2994442 RepID=A0A853I6D9_9GAMM|nr:DUF2000 domain-containing protein [Spartinivicinus marinus]MCX4027516.1 DUF2000 domain-containing protein [Spartinivicinus marinus]NYZ68893.1 DUF2000 domain-containing protein [Spartinivicinus marinus]